MRGQRELHSNATSEGKKVRAILINVLNSLILPAFTSVFAKRISTRQQADPDWNMRPNTQRQNETGKDKEP